MVSGEGERERERERARACVCMHVCVCVCVRACVHVRMRMCGELWTRNRSSTAAVSEPDPQQAGMHVKQLLQKDE
jgi:hypothetical protein